jgi:hypothetical protein
MFTPNDTTEPKWKINVEIYNTSKMITIKGFRNSSGKIHPKRDSVVENLEDAGYEVSFSRDGGDSISITNVNDVQLLAEELVKALDL